MSPDFMSPDFDSDNLSVIMNSKLDKIYSRLRIFRFWRYP